MGSGPRSRERPHPGFGRRRLGRAFADRLPSAVTDGLVRVAPVLGRPLGLRRALAGASPVDGGGGHRPSPPRLWWAAPWRRWEAEPEPNVGPTVEAASERVAEPAFMSNGRSLLRNAGTERARPADVRAGPTQVTGRPHGHVLRRSIAGQAVPSTSWDPASERRRPAIAEAAAAGERLRHAVVLPRRGATSLLRVAPVLRRPLGLSRAALGLDAPADPEAARGATASRPFAPPGTGVVRWFAGRWPSPVESSGISESESRIHEAVQSGVLEVKESRGQTPAGRAASGAAPPVGLSSSSTPGPTNAVLLSIAGSSPTVAGRRSRSSPPMTLRRRSSAPAPVSPSAAPPAPASAPPSAAGWAAPLA